MRTSVRCQRRPADPAAILRAASGRARSRPAGRALGHATRPDWLAIRVCDDSSQSGSFAFANLAVTQRNTGTVEPESSARDFGVAGV